MNKAVSDYFPGPGNDTSAIVDLRGLEPPEPMVQILLACAQLGPDENYLAHLPHVPNPLLPHLEARGLDWQIHEEADGSALILIRRRA